MGAVLEIKKPPESSDPSGLITYLTSYVAINFNESKADKPLNS